MYDTPWLGDACSLVEAFRSGERTPVEELETTLLAIAKSRLNAVWFTDEERALESAKKADTSLPFGGLPIGIKELESVLGWPNTQGSLVFKDRIASFDSTQVTRLRGSGAVPVGQTNASEFGGLNVSITKLHGITGNPWKPSQSAGGSSGGSASAVAGGLFTLATGGDGGGSIRIPAGFNGLVGMKGTAGRIPRGPKTEIAPMTVVLGCLARSVRDVARYYDVTAGHHSRDPYSLPKVDGWERNLGTYDLSGKRVVIVPNLGNTIVRAQVEERIHSAGEALAKDAGLKLVDVPVKLQGLGFEWAMANMASLINELGDLWPGCKEELTPQMAFGLDLASEVYNLEMAARVEHSRTEANELMADLFDQVDFVISATNPDVAFPADVWLNTRVGEQEVGPENNGGLTIPANICGNPAISIPVEQFEGLPVGMQIMGRHNEDALLLDLALSTMRERPWPLVAPGAPL